MAHFTNLVVQTLNSLSLVGKIESLFTFMHNYFAHSPKCHLEASNLAELLECKHNKIIKNIKTHYISMLTPSKRILSEYKALVVKMVKDNVIVDTTKTNYELLSDVETLMGFFCIILSLELVHGLSKFAQNQQTFICDFISTLKFCEADLFTMYYEGRKRFSS
jgi:hypothetical protein